MNTLLERKDGGIIIHLERLAPAEPERSITNRAVIEAMALQPEEQLRAEGMAGYHLQTIIATYKRLQPVFGRGIFFFDFPHPFTDVWTVGLTYYLLWFLQQTEVDPRIIEDAGRYAEFEEAMISVQIHHPTARWQDISFPLE